MSEVDLRTLHADSMRKNEQIGVTGILLYSGGQFIQLLEGQQPAVETLYKKISLDPRHTHMQCLFSRQRRDRLFSNWNMGLLNLDRGPELDRVKMLNLLTQYRDFGPNAESNALAINMLKEFRNQLAS